MKFLTLKPDAFGLDISDLSLKIIKLKKKGKFLKLASFGEVELDLGIVEKGEIKKEKEFIESIKKAVKAVKGERLKTNFVIASLPENKSFFTVIQMPKMKKEELRSAVSFEAENHVPFPIDEIYLDFQIIPPVKNSLDHLDILLSAFPKKIVDSYVFCLKSAGLFPLALEVESQSICRSIIKNGLSPFPVLIIDFGRTTTSFIIFSGYSLRFTASTSISSSSLDKALSENLKISLEEAEKIKVKYGLGLSKNKAKSKKKIKGKDFSQKDIFEAIAFVLSDLTWQAKKYITYYQTHITHEHLAVRDRKIEKIILCGRGANLKGLKDFLSLSLNLPVELGNPWVNILPAPLREVPQLPYKKSLGFTTALGLALRGVRGDF